MPERSAAEETARSERRGRVLLELATRIGDPEGTLPESLSAATEAAAEALGVARASVWLYDEARGAIVCQDLYVREASAHEAGAVLTAEDHPSYFAALAEERILAAEDAPCDPRTREFAEGYLGPHGIGAMLDAPIRLRGDVVGVVCNEHVGGTRAWTPAERDFAASLGDFVALALGEDDRRRAEAALREREAQLRLVTDHALDTIFEVDTEGTCLFATPNVAEVLGRSAEMLVGRNVFEHIHPDDVAAILRIFQQAVASVGMATAQFRYQRGDDGEWNWIEARGRAFHDADGRLRGVIVSRNVTERVESEHAARALEAQLSQAQRLESLGRLSGGIAHDFNNLLTAILGHTEMATSAARSGEPVDEELREIGEAARRAAELTSHLLVFGRQDAGRAEVVDANEAIEGVARMLRRLIGEQAELALELASDAPCVRIGRGQLDQLVMNLVLNARDAMPEGGRITVGTARVELTPEGFPEHARLAPGHYLELRVSDTGVGMDEQTRRNVFDPFFTTKQPGAGTGLGLTTIYEIARRLSGAVRLESEEGQGTRVFVWIPEAAPEGGASVAVPQAEIAEVALAGRRILVVEDEEAVSRVVEQILSAEGCKVFVEPDGAAALDRIEALGGEIDLVISDTIMPVMGGVELIRQLESRHPSLPVLLVSGYAPESSDAPPPAPQVERLAKPFTGAELRARVLEVLGAARPA